MTTTPIVFLDTETTSLQPDRRIWEVAMIRRDDQGERERRFFIRNVDLSNANERALEIGGFFTRHPQYAGGFDGQAEPRPSGPISSRTLLERYEAAAEIQRWTQGATIVGCNPAFDADALSKVLRSASLNWQPWHYRLVPVEIIAAGWLTARGIDIGTPPWKSETLAELCGIEPAPPEDRHTALGDARWVRSWWDAITAAPVPAAADTDLGQIQVHVTGATPTELVARIGSRRTTTTTYAGRVR